MPSYVDEYAQALAAGAPVVIGSGPIMCALCHAGLPSDEFAFGGPHFAKLFLISDADVVSEYVEDRDADAPH